MIKLIFILNHYNNMKKLLLVAIFNLFIFVHFSTAQKTDTCFVLTQNALTLYEKGAYKEAIKVFKKARKCNSDIAPLAYYQIASAASQLKKGKIALEYLEAAVNRGFEDTVRMQTNPQLDFIRKKAAYSRIIQKLAQKNDKLKIEFEALKTANFDEAIPYIDNGKWGWLDKKTKKPLTKPLFDRTGFRYAKGLPFRYLGAEWVYTNAYNIEAKQTDFVQLPIKNERVSESVEIVEDANYKGFETNEQKQLVRYSKKYSQVTLLDSADFALVRTDLGNIGIVNAKGVSPKNLDTFYQEIKIFYVAAKKTYYFAVKKNSDIYYIFYDLNGSKIYDKYINAVYSDCTYNRYFEDSYFFIGREYENCIKVRVNGKYNVLNLVEKRLLLAKNQEEIIMIDGASNDFNKLPADNNKGILEPYFLVKDNNLYFYIDTKGNEYRLMAQ